MISRESRTFGKIGIQSFCASTATARVNRPSTTTGRKMLERHQGVHSRGGEQPSRAGLMTLDGGAIPCMRSECLLALSRADRASMCGTDIPPRRSDKAEVSGSSPLRPTTLLNAKSSRPHGEGPLDQRPYRRRVGHVHRHGKRPTAGLSGRHHSNDRALSAPTRLPSAGPDVTPSATVADRTAWIWHRCAI